jgi:hypothetical protein
LAEKNYENIVEALTNNAISTAAASPFCNSTLSLPQSSFTFPSTYNQSDTYGIEDSERYHNKVKAILLIDLVINSNNYDRRYHKILYLPTNIFYCVKFIKHIIYKNSLILSDSES